MAFQLKKIAPWGRSFDEYVKMFSLSPEDLKAKIISCADGPAGFNAILTARGGRVVSIDPIYKLSAARIKKRIEEVYDEVLKQTRENKKDYIWKSITSLEQLGKIRMNAMQEFLSDFETGKTQKRYIAGSLPQLPFKDNTFDIALCSHFLFTYSKHLNLSFHLSSIKEILRVAHEARIFPLLSLNRSPSLYLEPIISQMTDAGYRVTIKCVNYEFQRGANKMLKILKK